MGFTPPSTTYDLTFEDGPLRGFTCSVKGMTWQEYLDNNTNREFATLFAQRLKSWNLTDENGAPVPTTQEGLAALEAGHLLVLVGKWVAAATDVSPFLPKPSSNGSNSLEQSLPMAPSSPNPSN